MVQLPRQPTRFARLAAAAGSMLFGGFRDGWRSSSLLILALLLGFYVGGNGSSYVVVVFPGGRPSLVLTLVLLLELVVRLRTRALPPLPAGRSIPLGWMLADNLRIGFTYAVALEAFKVGT